MTTFSLLLKLFIFLTKISKGYWYKTLHIPSIQFLLSTFYLQWDICQMLYSWFFSISVVLQEKKFIHRKYYIHDFYNINKPQNLTDLYILFRQSINNQHQSIIALIISLIYFCSHKALLFIWKGKKYSKNCLIHGIKMKSKNFISLVLYQKTRLFSFSY